MITTFCVWALDTFQIEINKLNSNYRPTDGSATKTIKALHNYIKL